MVASQQILSCGSDRNSMASSIYSPLQKNEPFSGDLIPLREIRNPQVALVSEMSIMAKALFWDADGTIAMTEQALRDAAFAVIEALIGRSLNNDEKSTSNFGQAWHKHNEESCRIITKKLKQEPYSVNITPQQFRDIWFKVYLSRFDADKALHGETSLTDPVLDGYSPANLSMEKIKCTESYRRLLEIKKTPNPGVISVLEQTN
jgi:hypothetical protein